MGISHSYIASHNSAINTNKRKIVLNKFAQIIASETAKLSPKT